MTLLICVLYLRIFTIGATTNTIDL